MKLQNTENSKTNETKPQAYTRITARMWLPRTLRIRCIRSARVIDECEPNVRRLAKDGQELWEILGDRRKKRVPSYAERGIEARKTKEGREAR